MQYEFLQLLQVSDPFLSAMLRKPAENLYLRETYCLYTVSQKKLCQCYFLNNSVKHWPILKIFGVQHHEEN